MAGLVSLFTNLGKWALFETPCSELFFIQMISSHSINSWIRLVGIFDITLVALVPLPWTTFSHLNLRRLAFHPQRLLV